MHRQAESPPICWWSSAPCSEPLAHTAPSGPQQLCFLPVTSECVCVCVCERESFRKILCGLVVMHFMSHNPTNGTEYVEHTTVVNSDHTTVVNSDHTTVVNSDHTTV